MPPTNLLREPSARLRLILLGRTLTLTASPWSAHLTLAGPQIAADSSPPEPVEPRDLLAEIAALVKNAEQTPVPLVANGPCLLTTKAPGGTPDAAEWGFGRPDSARRRAQHARDHHHADALHFLVEDVAAFAAAIVAHHLNPNNKTAREVRVCGVRAAGQIVAMIRRASP